MELKSPVSGQAQSELANANTKNDRDFGDSPSHLSVPLYLPRRPHPISHCEVSRPGPRHPSTGQLETGGKQMHTQTGNRTRV